eukprot:973241-Rhodomonas_salina.1
MFGPDGAMRLAWGWRQDCNAFISLNLELNRIGVSGAGISNLSGSRAGVTRDGAEAAAWLVKRVRECEALAHLDMSLNKLAAG